LFYDKRFTIFNKDNTNRSAFLYTSGNVKRIKDICAPLEKYFGIQGFSYLRIYNDCSYFQLTSESKDFLEKYFKKIKKVDQVFLDYLHKTPVGGAHHFIWPSDYQGNIINDPIISLLYEYNIWHGYDINFRYDEFCEIFSFTFNKNVSDRTNFYIQNSQILEKFCKYFKTQALDLIDDEDKSKIALYSENFDTSFKLNQALQDSLSFLAEIAKINQTYCINSSGNIVKLTPRELDCIKPLIEGKSVKTVANSLNISVRTLEFHLNNLKQKLGVHYKNELLERLMIQMKDGRL
jgi:DNA-binding CsgD family transcriptional regulator